MFKALLLNKTEAGFDANVRTLEDSSLPADGDVLVAPEYSTLNYKDALAITHTGAVVRTWPMVAGIDGAGIVLESQHPAWAPGDRVIHNGWGMGETRWGCLAQRVRLKGDQLVPVPAWFTARQAMAIGTAGYTAMLSVMAIQDHFARKGIKAADGEVLVTGATGGVGSVAVAVLARLGFHVTAATGKPTEAEYLQALGARNIIDRAELAGAGKPLQKERWIGAIDCVGSHTLVNVLAQVRYQGAVAACGLAQGSDLPGTVLPFILRGVTLYGIDSVMAPMSQRRAAWLRLGRDLDPAALESMIHDITLDEVVAYAHQLKAGQIRGRIVVRIA